MFVATIINLWTNDPVAWALTDENGNPKSTETPRELYMYIIEASKRSMFPLIVQRPQAMKSDSAWAKFLSEVPDPVWVYEDGVVFDENGNVVMRDEGDPHLVWRRHINNQAQRDEAQRLCLGYGSGINVMEPDELSVVPEKMYAVGWGK